MRLRLEQLHYNLKVLGLMGIDNNKPLSYSGFKNRASVHKYGKNYKVVFIGHPKQNLFGFYVMWGADSQVMKEAYELYVSLVKGDITGYDEGDIQWGNCGIPISYGELRSYVEENNFV
jgi:hypothetical protein